VRTLFLEDPSMIQFPGRISCRLVLAAVGSLFGLSLAVHAGGPTEGPQTLEQLRHLSADDLHQLFVASDMGRPLTGFGRGRLLCLTNERLPRLKVAMSNAFWRGKTAAEDGTFINRFVGGIDALESHYVIGPSWVDGRPAMLFEYPAGTPLFGNMHDELREIAPGLYLGPLYDRCPVPRFRGYLAVQVEGCAACGRPGSR
jgi:hypothetical protein